MIAFYCICTPSYLKHTDRQYVIVIAIVLELKMEFLTDDILFSSSEYIEYHTTKLIMQVYILKSELGECIDIICFLRMGEDVKEESQNIQG